MATMCYYVIVKKTWVLEVVKFLWANGKPLRQARLRVARFNLATSPTQRATAG